MAAMDEWEMSDEALDEFLDEWKAVDRAAADYLEDRIQGLTDPVDDDQGRWLDALVVGSPSGAAPQLDPRLTTCLTHRAHARTRAIRTPTARRPRSRRRRCN